jgi:hypothetical protein
MTAVDLHSLIPTLQIAIGPVILISGVALILLSMTNRLGRTVDRSRSLAREYRTSGAPDRERTANQLAILMRRARIMRAAIASASMSVLLAALLIISLFLGAILQIRVVAPLIATLFVACMASLITALVLFLTDINLSLTALRLDVDASLHV